MYGLHDSDKDANTLFTHFRGVRIQRLSHRRCSLQESRTPKLAPTLPEFSFGSDKPAEPGTVFQQ